jgi:transposase InsO family protein
VLLPPVEPGQYSSHDLERALRAASITASMGTVGDCYDTQSMIMTVGVGSLV